MRAPTDEGERLNWAASEHLISRSRWLFSAFNMVIVGYALWFSRRIGEPYLAIFIIGIVFATGAFWTKWRFKFYVTALSYIALAICSLILIGETHGKLQFWILSSCLWGFFGYTFWKIAGIAATVRALGWERERSLVKSWWQVLMSTPRRDDVIGFSTVNLWVFSYTFRLLKSGMYWAVIVASKHLGTCSPLGFGVRKLDEVEFLRQPDGEMKVRIGKRTFKATNMSPPNPSSV